MQLGTIIVLDDSDENTHLIKRLLLEITRGYNLRFEKLIDSAVFRIDKEFVSLVIINCTTGNTIVRRIIYAINALSPHTQIIAVIKEGDQQTQNDLRKLGANYFLHYPYEEMDFKDCVKEAMRIA